MKQMLCFPMFSVVLLVIFGEPWANFPKMQGLLFNTIIQLNAIPLFNGLFIPLRQDNCMKSSDS